MKLQKKGLLSDCEHLLTPLTTDQEGNLRGGFGNVSGIATNAINVNCKNHPCINANCTNSPCANGECSNGSCSNTECYNLTKPGQKPNPTEESTTKAPTKLVDSGIILCGLL